MFFETKNLCFSYYKSPLYLKDVNFSVEKNSKSLILASKDSGKTTILKVMSGFEDSRFGNIYLNDQELKTIEDKDKKFSLVLGEPILFENKSIKQNLDYQIKILEIEKFDETKMVEFLKEYDLNYDLNTKVRKLNLLEKRKLQIVRAIIKSPQILFLDDQFENLQENEIIDMLKIYQKLLNKKDLTIIFSIGDETYKKIRTELLSEKIDNISYLNLAKLIKFKSFDEFEKSYYVLDVLKFLDNNNTYIRYIEKQGKTYLLLNGEEIQFKFDSKFNKQLDTLKLDFAELEECVVMLTSNENLNDLSENKFNELLKSNECIIFSRITENRII